MLGMEMRSNYTLARLGGDEFVMMIPGADLEQGRPTLHMPYPSRSP